MRRTTVLRAVLIPLGIIAVIGGLYWLMLHGFLQLTAYLLVAAIVLMIAGTVWEWRIGHGRWAALLLVGALLTGGTVGAYGWSLNSKLNNIGRLDDGGALGVGPRPAEPAKPTKALNILLMGADSRDSDEASNLEAAMKDGAWEPGTALSDTIMVLHIPADRKSAYVVSIPRDSYVPIYDAKGTQHGSNKINYSFSVYGPYGTLRTVENLSGLRMNHLAIIDFAGFRDLTKAIGGVDVYVPETVEDVKQDITWEKGWHHIEGSDALKYVRQRHGLTNGDFDRVKRQQNFLRAVMDKVLDNGTIGNPVKLSKTLGAITDHLTVDSAWSNGDIRSLVIGLQGVRAKAVKFVTVPLDHYETLPDAGAVNIIEAKGTRSLFKAVGADTLARYLRQHPDIVLGSQTDVS